MMRSVHRPISKNNSALVYLSVVVLAESLVPSMQPLFDLALAFLPIDMCCTLHLVQRKKHSNAFVLIYSAGHRDCHQWVFLAGEASNCSSVPPPAVTAVASATTPAQQHDKQQQAVSNTVDTAATTKTAAAVVPSVLAVKLIGTETSVDWLEPDPVDSHSSHGPQQQQQQVVSSAVSTPASAATSTALHSNISTNRPSTRRFVAARQTQQAQVRETVVSCSNVILTSKDVTNNMWVATAHDTAVVSMLSGTAVGSRAAQPVQELLSWAQKEQQLLAQLNQRVRLLVQG